MTQNLVVTALGTNNSGIIHQLIGHVSNCGCNIVDSKLAIFGNEFTLIMLLSGEWNAMMQVESSLPLKSQELDLITMMKRTKTHHEVVYDHTVKFAIKIADAPGLIERFTLFFAQNTLNLAALKSAVNSALEPELHDELSAQFTLNTMKDCDLNKLEADLTQLCLELNAEFTFIVES